MKAEGFDRKLDKGEDILRCLDVSKAGKPVQEKKRVKNDISLRMLHLLDKEAKRPGVPRQSVIRFWVVKR